MPLQKRQKKRFASSLPKDYSLIAVSKYSFHLMLGVSELQAMQMINVYTKFAYEQTAIPVIAGRKSRVETFAGASITYTIEAMMGDQKALQAGTSHNLGQNFSRAFETQVLDLLL